MGKKDKEKKKKTEGTIEERKIDRAKERKNRK